MNPPVARRPWLAILALATVFAIKFGVLLQIGGHPLLVPASNAEAAGDVHLAEQVARGDRWLLQPASFFGAAPVVFPTPPLYVYVLAASLKTSGASLQAVRFSQILLGTLAVLLIGLTARRLYGERGGWAAGALAALYGVFTFHEVLVLGAALEPFLSALDLFLLTLAVERATPRAWLAAGAALGLHTLNQPHMLVVTMGLGAVLLVRAATGRTSRASALSFIAACLIVIAPATLRNYRATQAWTPITSATAIDLFVGNNPGADGTDRPPVALAPDSASFLHRAASWVRHHPAAGLRLAARKASYALSATFIGSAFSWPFFARDIGGLLLGYLAVGPTLFVPLGVIGLLAATRRARPATRPDWGVVAYTLLTFASLIVFFVTARERLPLQVALIVAAGGGVNWLAERVRARAWPALGAAAAAGGLLALGVGWPTGLDDGRTDAQLRLGVHEIQSGRAAPGEAWIARALARGARPAVVHLGVGQVYESISQPDGALTHYRRALALDPSDGAARYAAGRTLFNMGNTAEAIAELGQARAGVERDNATELLVLALTRAGRTDDVNRLIHSVDPSRWSADKARGFALALADAGRVDLSLAAWARAAETGGDARDYERLGLAWAVVGRPAEAAIALERAVRADPLSSTIRLNYAVALAGLNRFVDARREANESLRLDPGYERAKRFIEAIRQK